MSQENEFNESEVIEEEVLEDEIEDNEEDFGEEEEVEDIDWKARAIKAETAIIKNKKNKPKKVSKQPKTSNFDSQVDLLRFNGVTPNEIEKLKKIAVMEDIDLIDARNSDYFKMYKEKQEQEDKAKQSTMGASKRGRQTVDNAERIAKRVATTDSFSKDDIKALVHGK